MPMILNWKVRTYCTCCTIDGMIISNHVWDFSSGLAYCQFMSLCPRKKEKKKYLYIYGSSLLGACGGELACSTCHLIFEQSVYDTLPEKDEEEDDMLDLAMEVTET